MGLQHADIGYRRARFAASTIHRSSPSTHLAAHDAFASRAHPLHQADRCVRAHFLVFACSAGGRTGSGRQRPCARRRSRGAARLAGGGARAPDATLGRACRARRRRRRRRVASAHRSGQDGWIAAACPAHSPTQTGPPWQGGGIGGGAASCIEAGTPSGRGRPGCVSGHEVTRSRAASRQRAGRRAFTGCRPSRRNYLAAYTAIAAYNAWLLRNHGRREKPITAQSILIPHFTYPAQVLVWQALCLQMRR